MASTNVVTGPTPAQIARATAAAIPSEISTRPLLGIVGVLIGAGLVTLTGRMLSLGLADLRGHVGISFDQGAWFDSAYNAAIMFIGPFSVYLGGLLGPRRVLLFAAGVFTVTCAFLPFIHSYSLLVAALIVAGLTSGIPVERGGTGWTAARMKAGKWRVRVRPRHASLLLGEIHGAP